jgi:hypothetical protein
VNRTPFTATGSAIRVRNLFRVDATSIPTKATSPARLRSGAHLAVRTVCLLMTPRFRIIPVKIVSKNSRRVQKAFSHLCNRRSTLGWLLTETVQDQTVEILGNVRAQVNRRDWLA